MSEKKDWVRVGVLPIDSVKLAPWDRLRNTPFLCLV